MSRQKLFSVVLIGKSVLVREGISRILRASNVCTLASTSTADCLPGTILKGPTLFVVIHNGNDFEQILQQAALLHRQYPTHRTVILADNCQPGELVSAYQSGVSGYFSTSMNCDVFVKSLELVMMGETIVPYSLLPLATPNGATIDGVGGVADTAVAGAEGVAAPPLSARERSILDYLIEGYPNKSIARKINISEATVKVHVKAILRKIRVQNRTQAAIWAMNNGFQIRPHTDDEAILPVYSGGPPTTPLLPIRACGQSSATALETDTITRSAISRQLPATDRLV